MWSVQHADRQEICSVAGNWRRQWTTTDLVWCPLYWLGSCQSWYVLTIQFTPRRQADKEWAREKLLKAFKQNALSHRSGLLFFVLFCFAYSKRMGFEQLCERGWFWVKNRGFSLFFSLRICDRWSCRQPSTPLYNPFVVFPWWHLCRLAARSAGPIPHG